MTTTIRLALACASLLVAMPVLAMGRHQKPACDSSTAAVESAVAAACDCAGAATHGQFVRCAVRVVKGLASDGTLPRNCRGAMVRGFAKSTCGKPEAVTCCVQRDGATACVVRKAEACQRIGGTPGTGPLCIDACAPASPSGAFLY